jgi:CubicO group peptidase (beta-lactamase class C family)
MSRFLRLSLAVFLLVSTSVRLHAAAEAAAFKAAKLEEIDAAIEEAIANHRLPGGVLWMERNGAVYTQAYGKRALVPEPEPMTEDTIFDAASLTKVVATTSAIMLLAERGQLGLDEPVRTYIPEFKGHGKEAITVRQLMTHTSGLPRMPSNFAPRDLSNPYVPELVSTYVPSRQPHEMFLWVDPRRPRRALPPYPPFYRCPGHRAPFPERRDISRGFLSNR